MKKILVTALTACLLMSTTAAFADRRDNDHRGNERFDRGQHHDNGSGRRDNDRRWNNRRDDHDHVSLSLSFGNVNRWPSYNSFGWGVGSNFGPRPYYRSRQPVVIYQNTYIEPQTTVITRSAPRTGTSLLRDVQGRCFEREYDSYGNETRTELPASACNF